MPPCEVFLRSLVPKLGMLTFRSYLGRQFDRAKGAALHQNLLARGTIVKLFVLSWQLHANWQVMQVAGCSLQLVNRPQQSRRKSPRHGDRKVTGKDTYAPEMLSWRLTTLNGKYNMAALAVLACHGRASRNAGWDRVDTWCDVAVAARNPDFSSRPSLLRTNLEDIGGI
jgi:hypothetical protein